MCDFDLVDEVGLPTCSQEGRIVEITQQVNPTGDDLELANAWVWARAAAIRKGYQVHPVDRDARREYLGLGSRYHSMDYHLTTEEKIRKMHQLGYSMQNIINSRPEITEEMIMSVIGGDQ